MIKIFSLLLIFTVSFFQGSTKQIYYKEVDTLPEKALIFTSKSEDGIINSNNLFAIDLLKIISHNQENLFVSPFSIYSALALAYDGAAGETKEEIRRVMNITVDDLVFRENFKFLLNKLSSVDSSLIDINYTNALWIQSNLNVKGSYSTQIKNSYKATIRKTNFSSNYINSCNEINNWASEETKGKINEIVSAQNVNQSTKLILTNAIYLSGEWNEKFEKELTRKDIFYNYNSDEDSILFMNRTGFYNYFENEFLQLIEILYKEEGFSCFVLLPGEDISMNNFINSINLSEINQWMSLTRPKYVNLFLPKFQNESSFELKNCLKQIGINNAFSNSSDFSLISDSLDFQLSSFIHKTLIKIDEEKSEMAAVSAMIDTDSAPQFDLSVKLMKVNRPFFIIISYDKLILFTGIFNSLNKTMIYEKHI